MMKKNPLEWTVFGISLVLIALCVGALGREAWTRAGGPPFVSATIGQILERPDGFAVEIIIENSGDKTAAGVHLSLSVAATDERAEAVVDYVPYRSTRRAWLTLRGDPRQAQPRVRVLGYEEP